MSVIVTITFDDGDTEVFGPFVNDAAANQWITSVEDFLVRRAPRYLIHTLSDPIALLAAANEAVITN